MRTANLRSTRSRALPAVLAIAIASAMLPSAALPTVAYAAPQGFAPLFAARAADAVPGEYIVVLKANPIETAGRGDVSAAVGSSASHAAAEESIDDAVRSATSKGATVTHRFDAALLGYAAHLSPSALDAVRRDPRVSYVQANERNGGNAGAGPGPTTWQPNAPWHLDRIDQRHLPLNGTYVSWSLTGRGVNAYVVDSGIRDTHTQFERRVVRDFTAVDDGNGTRDCANGTGHGTFVASEIGGKTYGVAKKVTLHAVRVLGCDGSGTTTQIVAGMDWVARHRVKPAVANVSIQSFNGESNPAMDQAAAGMIQHGVVVVLIAGNFNRSDCTNSPKDPRALIAAATTINDARNTSLNPSSFGRCVSVFAPGADITGAGIASDTAVNQHWYGTSMAAPLVAGAVALHLQRRPNLTMQQAKKLIVGESTRGVVANPGAGSPNRLLYRPDSRR